MNQPLHIGPFDPVPGDNGSPPLEPTRVARFIEGSSYFEMDIYSLEIFAYGEVGQMHPDLK